MENKYATFLDPWSLFLKFPNSCARGSHIARLSQGNLVPRARARFRPAVATRPRALG